MLPFWDTAPDWCHYENRVGEAEVKYLISLLNG